jgi:glycosyltransferase involved in cell wall biosynthesis
VVVPAYNAEAYIGVAVESALAQSYPWLEVLVVDDGSTDGTAAVVEALAARDRRVRLLRQENGGVAAARNLAIAHARGDYVAPLDADDFWYPGKIEAQVRRIERGGPRMGLVYTWWMSVDQEGRPVGSSTGWVEEGALFEALLFTNFIGNASVPLIRRSCLKHVGGYDSSLRQRGAEGCEDWDLSLRIAARYDVGIVPAYLSAYRMVDGSMSSAVGAMARSYELVVERVRREQPGVPEALVRWSRANFYLYSAGVCYVSEQYTAVPHALATAVRADPAALLLPWVTRLAAKSLLRFVARPLTKRLWPTAADWRAFRERVRRSRAARPEASGAPSEAPAPWQPRGYYNHERLVRWQGLTAQTAPAMRPSSARPPVTGDGVPGRGAPPVLAPARRGRK